MSEKTDMTTLENERHTRYPAWLDIPRYIWSIAVSQKRQSDALDRLEAMRRDELKIAEHSKGLYRRDGKRFVKIENDVPAKQADFKIKRSNPNYYAYKKLGDDISLSTGHVWRKSDSDETLAQFRLQQAMWDQGYKT